ncbi:MAG TPA: TetR/AcrR family transcriptional regulator [Acidimicrobiales bacterium]|nr:TetR/AcrR family transcriptional regulator [Acidimicrobiales bacterium]
MASARGSRERLLAVAADLLEAEGVGGVSLREVARRAGLSHGTPRRHFPTRANLLAHVSADGFRGLHAAVGAAVAALGPGASNRARLAAASRGYVAFALAHPGLITLMFRFDLLDRNEPALAATSHAAFDQLIDLVKAAQGDGWRTEQDPRLLAGALWSSVHGLVSLWLDEAIQPSTGARHVGELLDPLLAMLVPEEGGYE